jgi:hypothetical protein
MGFKPLDIHTFGYHELGGGVLCATKPRIAKSRFNLNRWLCVEGANKDEPYPYRILGIGGLEKEELRVIES